MIFIGLRIINPIERKEIFLTSNRDISATGGLCQGKLGY